VGGQSARVPPAAARWRRADEGFHDTRRHRKERTDGATGVRQDDVAPPPKPATARPRWERTWVPDDVLLFRYSALTFNGHRIHYDRRYVTEVEGYPGLIVHGPLIATLLLDLLRHHLPDATVTRYEFRALRPLFDTRPFSVCGDPQPDGRTFGLWARDHEGSLAMDATATIG
jgi:3-methylfumaryl-CoA hydratase